MLFGFVTVPTLLCCILTAAVAIILPLAAWARIRFNMSGKSISGLVMLSFGILGCLVSIVVLVYTISHSPNNIGALMAGRVIDRELYPFFLVV